MGIRRKMVNMFFRSKRNINNFVRKKTTQKIFYASYQVYQVSRIIRNPFILLEYVNVFNALKLIGDRRET